MKHVRTAVQLALSVSLLAGYVACSSEELEPARVFSDGGTTDGSSIGPVADSGGSTGTDSSTGTDATTPTDASPPKDAGKKHDAGDGGQDAADASDAASATDAPADVVVDAADDGG